MDASGEWAKGYLAVRPLDDGTWLALVPLVGGRLRVTVCPDEWTAGEHY